ncbi:MAG: zeta toxin family protein [Bacteroidales bacterium]|nr:zeta toxin family protein [Bacteroidales bacterium]
MRGDILIIDDNHRKAASEAVQLILPEIEKSNKKFVISVAGESGAGKSEIAASIAEVLEKKGLKCFIFQQDDYFVYPPKTNAKTREKDINWVGEKEVKLDLIDEELKQISEGQTKIEKPLVIFQEDRIDKETVDLNGIDVIIVEGTYTTALKNVDQRVFINRDLYDTKASRLKRNREKQDEYLEKILMIEHEIISAHKALADVIITKDYNAIKR